MAKVTKGSYIRKDNQTLSGVVTVDDVDGGEVYYTRRGSRETRTCPVDEFLERHRKIAPAKVDDLYHSCWITYVDGPWFHEEQRPIRAWTFNEDWNGFACPYFEKADLLAAEADGRLRGEYQMAFYHEPSDSVITVKTHGEYIPDFDRDAVAALAHSGAAEARLGGDGAQVEAYIEACPGTDIKTPMGTVRVYDAGRRDWAWEEADEPRAEPEADRLPSP